MVKAPPAEFGGQEIIQFLIETEMGLRASHLIVAGMLFHCESRLLLVRG